MPTLYNIFSKSKGEKPIEKKPIEIDYREKNSLLPSLLMKNFDIEFKELKVADYIINGIAIERKTVQDFITSMLNRHLITQLEEMQQYPKRLLIIEGIEEQAIYSDSIGGVNADAVRGFILSILLKYNVPIIYTKNPQDTAKFMVVLSNKKDKEASINPNKKTLNKKERLQYILEGFPGIGPKTAKKLLEEFKTIKTIANADKKDLEKILGKKAEIVKKLFEERY